MLQEGLAGFTDIGRDLGQPDGGFHCLNLAEEGPDTTKAVMSPVLEQAGGFRGNLPIVRVGQSAPLINLAPQAVDGCGGVVLLGGG